MKQYTLDARYLKVTGMIFKGKYGDGSLALQIHGEEGPEVLSVNLGAYGLVAPEGHIYVRNYSQHEGLVEELERAGIAERVASDTDPHRPANPKFGGHNASATLMRVLV